MIDQTLSRPWPVVKDKATEPETPVEQPVSQPLVAAPQNLVAQYRALVASGHSGMAANQFMRDLEKAAHQQDAFNALVHASSEVSRVAGALDLQNLMRFILDQALQLIQAERGLLILTNDEGSFDVAAVKHLNDDDDTEALSRTLIDQVLQSGEAIITTNAQNDPRFAQQQSVLALSIRSVLAVPLSTPSGIIGALYLDTRIMTRIFDETDLPIITAFAGITASALELARAIDSRKELYLESVRALVNAVEAKDSYTAGHSSRVGLYSQAIARVMGQPESVIEQALIAGFLHDVGKIGVSDTHVTKPGPLTPEEWADFKQHPVIGERILEHSRALKPILPAVRWHHEKLDGSGYPDGLKGDAIPFLARIVCVADSFDAMTSDRSYRESLGKRYALSELRKFAGRQYDASVVRALEQGFITGIVPYLGKN